MEEMKESLFQPKQNYQKVSQSKDSFYNQLILNQSSEGYWSLSTIFYTLKSLTGLDNLNEDKLTLEISASIDP
jgi:hypothetical protein